MGQPEVEMMGGPHNPFSLGAEPTFLYGCPPPPLDSHWDLFVCAPLRILESLVVRRESLR